MRKALRSPPTSYFSSSKTLLRTMSEISKLSELPDDVISDIVLRALRLLPSVGDLSVVCKQWRGLISQNLVQELAESDMC
eukprot:gene16560-22789_t